MTTKAEQETTIRWDEEEQLAWLYTSYPPTAEKWRRLGYPVTACGQTRSGDTRSWEAKVPVRAVTFRKLVDGRVPTRPGHSPEVLRQMAQRLKDQRAAAKNQPVEVSR